MILYLEIWDLYNTKKGKKKERKKERKKDIKREQKYISCLASFVYSLFLYIFPIIYRNNWFCDMNGQ